MLKFADKYLNNFDNVEKRFLQSNANALLNVCFDLEMIVVRRLRVPYL